MLCVLIAVVSSVVVGAVVGWVVVGGLAGNEQRINRCCQLLIKCY